MQSFSGTTRECFAHYASSSFATGQNARKSAADFVHVSMEPTVRIWFTRGFVGTGESLIRTRTYLTLIGYDVDEVRNLAKPIRDLTRMLSYDLTSFDELVGVFEFDGVAQRDSVMRILTGKRAPSPERLKKLSDFVKNYREMIDTAESSVVGTLPRPRSFMVAAMTPAPSSRTAALTESSAATSSMRWMLSAFAKQVEAMIPFAERILSDDFSAEDRKKLREIAGNDGIFTLSNQLSRLCGEKARGQIPATSNKQ